MEALVRFFAVSGFLFNCVFATLRNQLVVPDHARVAHGDPAESSDFPSYAVVLDKDRIASCGATLVRPDAILTAAHCNGDDVEASYVAMGNIKLWRGGHFASARVVVPIKRWISHPGYVWVLQKGLKNDIAIAILSRPISGFPLAKLSKSSPRVGSIVSVTGLGLTETQNQPSSLRKTTMRVQARANCGVATAEQICLRPSKVKAGAYREICEGDSGGPAYYGGIQVGVTSWRDGKECGEGKINVYTDIGYHLESFILPTLEKYSSDDDESSHPPDSSTPPLSPSNQPSPPSPSGPKYNAYVIKSGGKLVSMNVKDCSSIELSMDFPRPNYAGQIWHVRGYTVDDTKVHRIYALNRGDCDLTNPLFISADHGDRVQATCPDKPDLSGPPPPIGNQTTSPPPPISPPPQSGNQMNSPPPPSDRPSSGGNDYDYELPLPADYGILGDYELADSDSGWMRTTVQPGGGTEARKNEAKNGDYIELYVQENCDKMSQAWILDPDWSATELENLGRSRLKDENKNVATTGEILFLGRYGSRFSFEDI